MRRCVTLLIVACAVLGAAATLPSAEWREDKGDHFIVLSKGDERFAKEVLAAAETYYKRIASDLGYPRYSDFWLWDDRVKIYIHPDHDAFVKATGQPDWSEGMADYRAKEIVSFAWSKDFIESLLPHEMAHLVFRDFVGFKGEVPLWLDEGVAQWAEESKRPMMKRMIREAYERDALLSLNDMMALDVRRIVDKDKLYMRSTITKTGERGVLFLSATNLVQAYYLQAVAMVGFLIEKFGSIKFAAFCRELRDGKSLEDSFRSAYPTQIDDLATLEKKWRAYIAEMK